MVEINVDAEELLWETFLEINIGYNASDPELMQRGRFVTFAKQCGIVELAKCSRRLSSMKAARVNNQRAVVARKFTRYLKEADVEVTLHRQKTACP